MRFCSGSAQPSVEGFCCLRVVFSGFLIALRGVAMGLEGQASVWALRRVVRSALSRQAHCFVMALGFKDSFVVAASSASNREC